MKARWSFLALAVPLIGTLAHHDADAANPCSVLPQGGTLTVPVPAVTLDPTCDANCSGISLRVPVPSGAVWDFTDASRNECAIAGGPANGKCKKSTLCPPGTARTNVGGQIKCVKAASTKQLSCPSVPLRQMPFVVDSLTNYVNANAPDVFQQTKIDGNAERRVAQPTQPGCYKDGSDGGADVIVRGPNVALASRARIVGLPAVAVQLVHPPPTDTRPETCRFPGCVKARFTLPDGVPLGRQEIELSLPTNRVATRAFTVVPGRAWAPTQCRAVAAGRPVRVGGSTNSTPQPSYRSYQAGMTCPGYQTAGNGSREFVRFGARFTVSAPAGYVDATVAASKTEECGWEGALTFKLTGPSGQDITIDPTTFAAVPLRLNNGDYVLEPPTETNPNPDWPYGYTVDLGFSQ